MKLLFITQKVDKDDNVLGVYHRWIEKLAEKLEKVSVICLYRGRVDLPDNARVFSLGKESGPSRLKYLWRFYKYIWILRKEYGAVFVHMNKEYVVLGWKLWKLLGKRIFFWYNHPLGDFLARLAIAFSDKIFYTSPFAFAARYKKSQQMAVGIDVNLFRRMPDVVKKPNSILYLGRLSPIKYIEVLIDAALMLDSQGAEFTLTIIGDPSKFSEVEYAASLKKQAEPLVKKNRIIFVSSVPNNQTPRLYNEHAIYVNLTPTGSFDKTIIEAMASESLVVTSNEAVSDVVPAPFRFEEKNAEDLARALKAALGLSGKERQDIGANLRKYVVGRHDLATLVNRLAEVLN